MQFPFSSTSIGFSVLVLAVIVLAVLVVRLDARVRALTRGKNGTDIEGTLREVLGGHRELIEFRTEIEEYLRNVEQRLRRSVQGVGTVRFNPFQGSGDGGRQSFATALIDENGNGIILSSLASRDRMSFFAKPLAAHVSEYPLTDEERESVAAARATLTPERKKKPSPVVKDN